MNSLERFFCLSPMERAAHYRELADLTRSRAKSAMTKDTHENYLIIAAQWLRMAEKLEAEYGKTRVIVQSEFACLLRQETLLSIFPGIRSDRSLSSSPSVGDGPSRGV